MSNLWLVRDLACNRMAVMKTASEDLRDDPQGNDRFRAENRILARLSHPNIVQLYGVFLFAEQRAMIMELIDGATLTDYRKGSALPLQEAVRITLELLSALSYAHGEGVTHRDIKPSNVMITKDGRVKLVDFGISKCVLEPDRTYPGTTMGSAYYMSPEQILGMRVDSRCDLYSLGIMLYEMLTGERPFRSETGYGVMEQHLKAKPEAPSRVNPNVPKKVSQLVLKAISKRPDERFQSADEFAAEVRLVCGVPKATAQKALVRYQAPRHNVVVRIRVRYPRWMARLCRISKRTQ